MIFQQPQVSFLTLLHSCFYNVYHMLVLEELQVCVIHLTAPRDRKTPQSLRKTHFQLCGFKGLIFLRAFKKHFESSLVYKS